MRLWKYLKDHMLGSSKQTVCENEAEMTYEELVAWAEHFACRLKGYKSCAIICNSEMAAAMALLACFAAGVTAIPLSMRYGIKHCEKILHKISPQAVIHDKNGGLNIIEITDSTYETPRTHPALIMGTSGTTGTPKGAMLSEQNIISNVKDIAEYFELDKKDTILIARPLYHCAVLTGEFLVSLVKGCKIRFYSSVFNPPQILEMIKKYRVTTIGGTPTFFKVMVGFMRDSDVLPLKQICISGECLDRETGLHIAARLSRCQIYHVYGLTEASPRVSYLPPNLFAKYPDFVGKPLNSVTIKVVDKAGRPCGLNKEGIIWVKGKNVMLGYYQDDEKTNLIKKNGWLCTGDVGFINKEGFLKIKGRHDDLIIKAGMNIYPAEIESVLKEDARFKDVLAYGVSGKHGTQIGINVVGDFKSKDEVKKICVALLPSFQVPTHIALVDEIQKNASGKVIRSGYTKNHK